MADMKNDSSSREKSLTAEGPSRGRPRTFDIDKALTTAMKIFWEKGYIQTTMMDLCHAIGIKPPSFYHAFGSKEELFLKTLNYYIEFYWNEVTRQFMAESDIHEAVRKLFEGATRVYMRPSLPKGCFIDISTIGLPDSEHRIREAISEIQRTSLNNIRKRLIMAVESGQLPPDCSVPVITNAIYTYLKGISAISREHMCQAELKEMSALGVSLLPPKSA